VIITAPGEPTRSIDLGLRRVAGGDALVIRDASGKMTSRNAPLPMINGSFALMSAQLSSAGGRYGLVIGGNAVETINIDLAPGASATLLDVAGNVSEPAVLALGLAR